MDSADIVRPEGILGGVLAFVHSARLAQRILSDPEWVRKVPEFDRG